MKSMQPTHVSDGVNVRVFGDYVAWVKRCKFEGWVWYSCDIYLPSYSRYSGFQQFFFNGTESVILHNVLHFDSTIDSDEKAWGMVVECITALRV